MVEMERTEHVPEINKRLIDLRAEETRQMIEGELQNQAWKVDVLERRVAAFQDHNLVLERCLADERKRRENSESELAAQAAKAFALECQRDFALKDLFALKKRKRVEQGASPQGNPEQECQRDFVVNALRPRNQDRESTQNTVGDGGRKRGRESQEIPVEDKLATPESEKNTKQVAVAHSKAQETKRSTDLTTALKEKENMEKKLKVVQRERDNARRELAKQRAEVSKGDTDLAAILIEKRNLERKLTLVEDEKAQLLNLCEDRLKTLEYAQREELRMMSKISVDTEMKLETLRKENSQLDSAHKLAQRNLEEETEKTLCQICMELPKDTICFPCLHLNYCFSCLEQHTNRSNTCPSCRTPISGNLKLRICE